jgi:flagellar motility protein MotE (MotC chaperone)
VYTAHSDLMETRNLFLGALLFVVLGAGAVLWFGSDTASVPSGPAPMETSETAEETSLSVGSAELPLAPAPQQADISSVTAEIFHATEDETLFIEGELNEESDDAARGEELLRKLGQSYDETQY